LKKLVDLPKLALPNAATLPGGQLGLQGVEGPAMPELQAEIPAPALAKKKLLRASEAEAEAATEAEAELSSADGNALAASDDITLSENQAGGQLPAEVGPIEPVAPVNAVSAIGPVEIAVSSAPDIAAPLGLAIGGAFGVAAVASSSGGSSTTPMPIPMPQPVPIPTPTPTPILPISGPAPSVVISHDGASVANAATGEIVYTFTFSSAVNGFTVDDVAVANATKGVFTRVSDTVYTLGVTAAAGFIGSLTVDVAAASAADVYNQLNTAALQSVLAVDTVRPTAQIIVADNNLIAGETSLVTIIFSEAVTGFANADLTLANGTLSAVSSVDGGVTWTATLTPSASVTNSTNLITLANTGVIDAAGNANTGTTDSNNYAVNTARPTASIVVADNNLIVGETSLVTITFSEAVTGFSNANLAVANGTLSAVSSADGGVTWTATLTPSTSTTDATNDITLANASVINQTGNANSGATLSNNYAVDTVIPTATIVVTNNVMVAGGSSPVTITFSEAVTGFSTADLVVTNGTLSTVSSTDGGVTWTATFTPATNTNSATNNITLASASFTDLAGNPNSSTTQSNQYAINTTAPVAFIDLSAIAAGTGGFVINGQCANDYSGASVAAAGDVNGDGLADLIVGAYRGDPAAGSNAGRSYVVFGRTGSTTIDLSAITAGTGGFVINGQCASDFSGTSVAAAGDINGDGLADLIIGARNGDTAAGNDAGRSYVVFGRTSSTAVNLSAIAAGTGGFVINGQCTNDSSGYSVAAAGDVNGDGLADLIVGALRGDTAAGNDAGRSYVVFGRTGSTAIDLSAIAAGTGGFVINGQGANDNSGRSVAAAGDVNGDGLADLIVGASNGDPAAGINAGRSYVVFGRTGSTTIDLSAIATGTGGFVINGQCANDRSGRSVAAAGDVNGDGLADLIVGAPNGGPAAGSFAGRSYVIFGRSNGTPIDLSTIATGLGGFVINGQCTSDYSGSSVAAAGDVNGDGLADLIVGALRGDPAGGNSAGRSYVVFGRTGSTAIDLSAIAAGIGGFVINGQGAYDRSGTSVAAAGDVNGDGLADLIVGADRSDPAAGTNAGRSYVIFGSTTGAFVQTAVDQLGTSGNDILTGTAASETIVGGAGDDILIGNGGADVLIGASGNDTLIINASNIAALTSNAGSGNYARLNGGSGIDTLSLAGAGLTFDLDTIANQGGAAPSSSSRIESIERIDITGSGNNILTLYLNDVIDMAGMNSFNNANGWADGTYNLASGGADGINPEQRHQLVIDGNAGDVFNSNGWGTSLGTVTNSGHTYDVYNQGAAQLLVDSTITTNIATPPTATITVSNTALTIGSSSLVTIAFSQAVTGFTNADLTVRNGTLSTVSSADGGVTWTATLTPLPKTISTANEITLATASVANLAGDTNRGAAQSNNYVVDTVADIDLSAIAAGIGGFVINGQCAYDNSGRSVAAAGDVNGDGLADLIVGAYGGDPAAGSNAGRSYVVFGRTGSTAIDLSAIAAGIGGFVINGQNANDNSGRSVAAAGDVNGDGLADVIVGANRSDPAAGSNAGRSYVIFGRTASTAVDLSAVATGTGGFVINGQCVDDRSGFSVAAAGDVNGDGLADLIVGADGADPAAGTYAGRSYVVFGSTGTTAINLSAIAAGTGGFVINGHCGGDISGTSVSAAGDVNGDGLADLIVGAPKGDTTTGINVGRSYVVFGRAGSTVVNLSDIAAGTGGFVIVGQCADDNSGYSVSAAGDVNGDGLADLIVGAYRADPAAGSYAGRSYVVFGRTASTAIDLSAVAAGTGGFVINGQCTFDLSGGSTKAAGDVNGDGLADLIVGASGSNPAAGSSAGRSYVVFGTTASTPIDLSAVAAGTGGFVINGQCTYDRSGTSVAAAGDVNGDGLADLIVGANGGDPTAGSSAGRSYVIFGSTTGAFAETAVDQLGTSGNDTLIGGTSDETIVGGAGNDILIGNGGADVLYGGSGDDTFIINAGNISALASNAASGNYARIDGGTGIDTLTLAGAGLTFNFNTIANQGGSAPSSSSRIESIERIDITGSGNNTLTLALKDVLDMAGMNSFNNATGWADGTYNLASGGANGINPEQRHQLVIDGNAGDTVSAIGWGTSLGTVTNAGHTYDVYNQGTFAQLLIDTTITRNVIAG